MARAAFTLRIPTEERTALETLSRIEGRPMNQLLNEAIKGYLSRRGRRERSLEESLARLRAYREKDPDFQQAVAAFVDSEASIDDPLEGTLVPGGLTGGERQATGPAQSRIRELLSA